MDYSPRAYEYWVTSYRRVWRGSIVTSLVSPILYLSAMGIGLGRVVNHGAHPLGIPYLDFVAPGLLAAVCMQVATFESAYPVMGAIRWTRQFHAQLSSPLRIRDVVLGHQMYVASRAAIVAGIYLVVITAFGAVHSIEALAAWPAAVLMALAFSAPVCAFAAWLERDEGFNALFRFGITPMFLFGGTFFPVTRLPHVFREIAYATPLWHAVDLMRHLTLGTATIGFSLLHVAYLALWATAGLLLAQRTFARRLVT